VKSAGVGRGREIEPVEVRTVEGKPVTGAMRVQRLLRGRNALMVRFDVARGTATPIHRHEHESLLYVVRGRLRATVGGAVHELGSGDAVLHPPGVKHAVEALARATWIEVKAPPEEAWRAVEPSARRRPRKTGPSRRGRPEG
jgi:quercetin dioxygenase-like cupin family protein